MWRLLPLLLTVFIDSLGFAIVFPIFSVLVVQNHAELFSLKISLGARGLIFGMLISTFCVGQFFAGPILGTLSDRKGRKRVLIATMVLGFVGYAFAALAILIKSISLLFGARLLSGVAAGNYTVAQSVIVDTTEDKERTKNFGILGMAWGLGFVLGPYLGGKLIQVDATAPFLGSALLCLITLPLLIFRLKESRLLEPGRKMAVFHALRHIKKAVGLTALRGIFLVMFIFSLGWGFFTEFSSIFLIRYFGLSPQQMANFYAWIGLWIAICQGLLIRPFLKRFSSEILLRSALLSLGLFLPIMLLIEGSVSLFWLVPLIAFAEALIAPCASTVVSSLSDKEAQGEILGVYNSVQWVAIGIIPMMSGGIVALHPHLPITISSCCMLIAFMLALWYLRRRVQAGTQEIPIKKE